MMGLFDYSTGRNPGRDQVVMNALQKLAADQQLGGGGIGGQIAQGLAGYASGGMQVQAADQMAAQQRAQQQAYGDIYNNLSQGRVNDAIAGANKYVQAGGDPKNLDRLKEIFDSVVKPQTTLDAQGRPRFVGTAAAISGNMQNAPETRNMLSDAETARNNQANNAISQGNLGVAQSNLGYRGQELALRQQEIQQGRAPSGYRSNSDGSLSPIPGGPADIKAQAAAQGKPLPNTVLKELATNQGAINKIDNALAASSANPDAFGLHNYIPGVDRFTNDPNALSARASIADIGSQIIHDRSGAAVTVSEMPRLKPFIPDARDTPQQVKVKLSQLKKGIEEVTNGYLTTYEAQGYNVNGIDKKNTSPIQAPSAPKALTYNPSTKKFE